MGQAGSGLWWRPMVRLRMLLVVGASGALLGALALGTGEVAPHSRGVFGVDIFMHPCRFIAGILAAFIEGKLTMRLSRLFLPSFCFPGRWRFC